MTDQKDAYYPNRDGFPEDLGHASLFLQWKGIDICADFRCTCGEDHHICGKFFVYAIRCTCGALYELPHTIRLVPNDLQTGAGFDCRSDATVLQIENTRPRAS